MSEHEVWKRARWAAFRTLRGGEAFGSIADAQDVWGRDPFDEETIHAEARQSFADLIEVAADRRRGGARGRIFLLLGDAGAGKTHLMGAFRRQIEEVRAGRFVYAQMSTTIPDLTRYLLRSAIESLQRSRGAGGSTQFMELSDTLVERACIPAAEREALRGDEEYAAPLSSIRHRLMEDLHRSESRALPDGAERETIHEDFLTALLVLQRRDGNATAAAMKYLRGDPLSAENLQWLCSPQGLSGTGEPSLLMKWLVGVVRDWSGSHGGAFVYCIDQIEEAYIPQAGGERRFPELLGVIRSLTENQPGFVAVLACLRDYYNGMRGLLPDSQRDRLELDTKPVNLSNARTVDEITLLIAKRLALLDAETGITRPECGDPHFPFTRDELAKLQGLRPRAILAACREGWRLNRKCQEPKLVALSEPGPVPLSPAPVSAIDWPQKWNDFRLAWSGAPPKAASDYADALAVGINALGQQTQIALRAESAADLVHLTLAGERAIAGICEGAAQGGKLHRQIKSLYQTAVDAGRPGIAIRSTEFAKSPRAQVYDLIGELAKTGGRRAIIPEADWRAVQAWREFERQHQAEDSFAGWTRSARPLTEIVGLRELVRLDDLIATDVQRKEDDIGGDNDSDPCDKGSVVGPKIGDPADGDGKTNTLQLHPDSILLGERIGLRSTPVYVEIPWLTEHLAVLGGTGSGKTTAAMNIIEYLLLRGVPAILVDRKGDLARYGDAEALASLPGALGSQFREQVEVAIYTPGAAEGRPLALSVLPKKDPASTVEEIGLQAEDAAQALGTMLGYGDSRSHAKRRAALVAAVRVLLTLDDAPASVERLLHLMNEEDPALLQEMSYLDHKLLGEIVQDLDSFRKLNGRILSPGAEPLDAASLLGLGAEATPGRTRLSIVSTKFLGGNEVIQFWVAQLMLELARFASTRPSRTLQAVIMLDEADLYLPAVGKPASKQPVESALRRFRSQGIGVILATQSPGDFDYRCRENIQTWLCGRIKETRALEKLRPVFGQEGASAREKLGQHATGEFCLVRPEGITRVQAVRNLLRTEQLSDAEIIAAARRTRRFGTHVAPPTTTPP